MYLKAVRCFPCFLGAEVRWFELGWLAECQFKVTG